MPLNRAVRRLVPSTANLTYHPIFLRLLDLFDWLPKLWFREFRKLPPNHLRIRVGVSNRLFANQAKHLMQGIDGWLHWFSNGWVDLESDIIELGVGCGRRAMHMRDFEAHGERYAGSYLGIDIDGEALAWDRANFDERFEFAQSTQASSVYRNELESDVRFQIPRPDGSVDFMFAGSVFSHLLEDAARDYLTEAARVLKPGARLVFSCFCLDLDNRKMGERYTFGHQIGLAYVESLAQPEAAVAYDSADIKGLVTEAGFRSVEVMTGPHDVQNSVVCER